MSEVILTKEEQKNLKGKKDEAYQLLANKAILAKAKEAEFDPMEKKELDYITETEKSRFYVSKFVNPKVNVSENQIVEIYNANKEFFDNQNMNFEQARVGIQNDLFSKAAVQIEAEYINTIVDNMSKDIVISKEDLKFTKGNAEVLRLFIINKAILEDAKKNNFEKEEKENLKILEDNVLLNYYADRTVKDKIRISQQEIEQIYNDNKENFGDTPIENAYNQIGNSLVTQKVTQLKQELLNQIAKEYDIDTEIKKYNL